MNAKEIIRQFVTGEMTFDDFMVEYNRDNEIRNFVNDIRKNELMDYVEFNKITYETKVSKRKYDIDYFVKMDCKIKDGKTFYSCGNRLNIFSDFSGFYIKCIDSNVKPTNYYHDRFSFLLDYCPNYLLSVDVENSDILDNLLDNLPKDLKKSEKGKLFKQKLKEMFYVEGNKYPRWIQYSDWPLSKTGKPTKYLRSESIYDGEARNYYFLDVDTNEIIKVFQSF